MGRRSLQASEQGIQAIKKALKSKKWSQTYLAGAAGCSRQTIWSLLQGKPTDCDVFMAVCNQLGLRQEEIVAPELFEPEQDSSEHIDALIQTVRESIRPYIQERCGMMRVLDMEQPIGLGDIYTSVNILERITGRRGLDISELMQNADPEQFDRFCLGKVREKRVPGLEAVEKFSKLTILGKPGAGKTTFLKHLAIQCIGGKFQSDRVPIFITLKDFAEADEKPNLLAYIERLLSPDSEDARPNASPLHNILRAGKALILLDGLDEVGEADSSRVLRQIREFSGQFSQNQFVITCRIAAQEYAFEQFVEVEVADFDNEQISEFTNKWFHNKQDPIKAERFLQKIEEDISIQELATNPLLLTLLCLVFEDCSDFPSNRAELYRNGIDVLLRKWDARRNIERTQIYKKLSLKRKEDLLGNIAFTTFNAGSYFFKEREVKQYISQYIQNLPNTSNDPEGLELDSSAILKSIEAQHGLLVERARGIYSFSHLTFQEYFTAHKVFTSCNPYTADQVLYELSRNSTKKRWREVLLLTTSLLDSADILLQLMKNQIDALLINDRKIQNFLEWSYKKSKSIRTRCKESSIRSFYFWYGLTFLESKEYHFGSELVNIPKLTSGIDKKIFLDISESDIFVDSLYKMAYRACYHEVGTNDFFCQIAGFVLPKLIQGALEKLSESSLTRTLKKLGTEVLDFVDEKHGKEEFHNWRDKRGKAWTEQLRKLMLKHRNIGHDWNFSEEQKQLLEQYYYANVLLVDCLNSDCYVSQEVRQEIEDTLLLPIEEIEKRKQQ